MSLYRGMAGIWLAGLLTLTLWLAYQQLVVAQHIWSLNDWLISYAGGFVRRGLPGQVVLTLPFPPVWTVFAIVGSTTTIYLICVWRFIVRAKPDPMHWFLLACPALFLFPITDVDGAFRKEILFYAYYAIVLHLVLAKRMVVPTVSILPLLILSHEALIALAPALLFPLSQVSLSRNEKLWVICVALASIAAFAFSVLHTTNSAQIAVMCEAMTNHGSMKTTAQECVQSGALSWIDKPISFGWSRVLERAPDYLADLPWLLALLAVPLVANIGTIVRFFKADPVGAAAFRYGLIASLILWVPLYCVATDWGRWLSMQLSVLCLQILYMSCLTPAAPARWKWYAAAVLVPIYATVWQLGHYHDLLRPGIALTLAGIVPVTP